MQVSLKQVSQKLLSKTVDIQMRQKGQFYSVLTLLPRMYAFFNKTIFHNNSYLGCSIKRFPILFISMSLWCQHFVTWVEWKVFPTTALSQVLCIQLITCSRFFLVGLLDSFEYLLNGYLAGKSYLSFSKRSCIIFCNIAFPTGLWILPLDM